VLAAGVASAQEVVLTPPAGPATPAARLLTSLASFVGNDADECGRFPLGGRGPSPEDLQPALDCAEASSGARRAFRLYAQRPGRAFAATGLIGTPDGRIWRFTYDTSACTLDDCFGQLLVTRCDGPRLQRSADGAAEWGCASEPAEQIPSIPVPSTASPCTSTASRSGTESDLNAAWIRQSVSRVRRAWVQPPEAYTTSGKVVVEFDVQRDGTVVDVLVTTRLSPALDAAVVRAIQTASPLPPLPASYTETKAHLSAAFCYTP
jgi:TonB family protein